MASWNTCGHSTRVAKRFTRMRSCFAAKTRTFATKLVCNGARTETKLRMSFVNHHHTQNGGTHDKGLRGGAAAAVRELVRDFAPQSGELLGEDIRAGLTAVVSVWLAEPILESATRSGLGSPEVEGIVRVAVRRGVRGNTSRPTTTRQSGL